MRISDGRADGVGTFASMTDLILTSDVGARTLPITSARTARCRADRWNEPGEAARAIGRIEASIVTPKPKPKPRPPDPGSTPCGDRR